LGFALEDVGNDHVPATRGADKPGLFGRSIFLGRVIRLLRRALRYTKNLANGLDLLDPDATGQEAIVADAMKTLGQDME
jgi:hypothetical protein